MGKQEYGRSGSIVFSKWGCKNPGFPQEAPKVPLLSTPCLSSAKETQSYLRQGTEVPWELQRPRLHSKDSLVCFHGTENEVRPEVWGTAEPPVLGFGIWMIKPNRTRVIDFHLKIARLSYTCQVTLGVNPSSLEKDHRVRALKSGRLALWWGVQIVSQ